RVVIGVHVRQWALVPRQRTNLEQHDRTLMGQLVADHQVANSRRVEAAQLECGLDRRPQTVVAVAAAELQQLDQGFGAVVAASTRRGPPSRPKPTSTSSNPSLGSVRSCWGSKASASREACWRPPTTRPSSSSYAASSMALSSYITGAVGTGTRWFRRKKPASP